MGIVATEIESIHGEASGRRLIFYRCQDDLGVWHSHGPVITIDPNFDYEAHKTVISQKVEDILAQSEIEEVLS